MVAKKTLERLPTLVINRRLMRVTEKRSDSVEPVENPTGPVQSLPSDIDTTGSIPVMHAKQPLRRADGILTVTGMEELAMESSGGEDEECEEDEEDDFETEMELPLPSPAVVDEPMEPDEAGEESDLPVDAADETPDDVPECSGSTSVVPKQPLRRADGILTVASMEELVESGEEECEQVSLDPPVEVVKRKRGRPRKNPLPVVPTAVPVASTEPPVKRKRGRPPKNQQPIASSSSSGVTGVVVQPAKPAHPAKPAQPARPIQPIQPRPPTAINEEEFRKCRWILRQMCSRKVSPPPLFILFAP